MSDERGWLICDKKGEPIYYAYPFNELCWSYNKSQQVGSKKKGIAIKHSWKRVRKYGSMTHVLGLIIEDLLADMPQKKLKGIEGIKEIPNEIKAFIGEFVFELVTPDEEMLCVRERNER